MPDFALEKLHAGVIAGVDEAGRGPWAGPVVAAAVVLWRDGTRLPGIPRGLNDSKLVPAPRREALFDILTGNFAVGIGIVDVAAIDALNIWGATKLAMRQAVESLKLVPDMALVDGHLDPGLPCRAVPVVKGDTLSFSIAAASIVAKVTRDRIMRELHAEFPQYGWESNVGYGTPSHQEGLRLHGVTPHHRRSYAPIRELLGA